MPREKEEKGPLVEGTKPFTLLLGQIEGGALHDDLSDQIRQLNAAMSEYAASNGIAKGSIILKLNFKLEGMGVLEVTADVTTKHPKFKREKTVLWLTPGNNTTDTNPKQTQMFPRRAAGDGETKRTLDEPATPARKV